MIVIGIDPDSKAHGVAIYHDGKLASLHNWELMQLHMYVATLDEKPLFSIEDVSGGIHGDKRKGRDGLTGHMSKSVGMCYQSMVEVVRMLEWHSIPYVMQKKSKKWKGQAGKKEFQAATGWPKSGNDDTRSAAYFGWLAIK